MTITDLVHVAEAIHNAEGYDLGKSSNREYRNAFWARVIGVVHHGHPLYNPAPDSRWLLKREPNGPQSDDVAAFWPSREAWDCIPGAGADGYWFEAQYLGVLAPHQVIYAPPMPEEYGPVDPPDPPPPPPPVITLPGREEMMNAGRSLHLYYRSQEGLQRPDGLWKPESPQAIAQPDWEGIGAWLFDVYLHARIAGQNATEAMQAVIAAIRQTDEWRAKHPGETP